MTVNDTLNTVKDFATKNLDRVTSLGELHLSTYDRLLAKQAHTWELLMEHGHRTLSVVTNTKGYNDFLKGQIEVAKELSERMMVESKANLAMASQVREDYRSWYEVNVTEISAEMRKVVPAL